MFSAKIKICAKYNNKKLKEINLQSIDLKKLWNFRLCE